MKNSGISNSVTVLFIASLLLTISLAFFLVVHGINKSSDKTPVELREYEWIDSLVEECPAVRPEVEKDLKKGYITKKEDRELWGVWDDCQKSKNEQKKQDIINKYRGK